VYSNEDFGVNPAARREQAGRRIERRLRLGWGTVLCLALSALCLGLSACRMPLRHDADGYRVDHPLTDYDDSVFVWTDAGRAAPRVIDVSALADRLVGYDVVFFGEFHDHAGVHLAELRLLRALFARDPRWILSLEQFERDVQGTVDAYLAGKVGEIALIDQGRAWENYAGAYRPLLTFAKLHHLPVVAAEAPEWAVDCVGDGGLPILEKFTPLERSEVAAQLHVTPGPYRDKFMAFQSGSAAHGGGAATPEALAKAERSFDAQILRDDTMAESIANALAQHPGDKVLHVTGSFHAADFLGTVERLKLRDPGLKIAVIEPVQIEDGEAPVLPADESGQGTAALLLYPSPEPFVEGEDMSAWIAKMVAKRKAHTCKYMASVTSSASRP